MYPRVPSNDLNGLTFTRRKEMCWFLAVWVVSALLLSRHLCFFSSHLYNFTRSSLPPVNRYLYFSEASVLTLAADMVFWVLLADAFLVVANRHKQSEARPPRVQSESSRRPAQEAKLMSYEEAYIAAHSRPK